jgi:hypothetical protein
MRSEGENVLAGLVALVESAGDDAETADRIEAARDQVRGEHVAALVEVYGRLADWPQRRALIALIQDHLLPVAVPAMRHFLAGAPSEGSYEHALAVAAAHVDGDLSHFDRYLDVPGAIDAARRAARARGS